ncbi:cell envelope integrity protein CreD [Aurantiacibacter poecillastricola]|uniref:cell envelope integrity protein CreD n=1 Tax=Aurantiacibacter poecillastricola TaxID=3064385 RepID=UPI00273FC88C|nr:cell envelope integrity protein CreD [Aurantiacibacter sp. 219JJ12-13]MDP5261831.1 cell envelope integrity protein CreD [Aurantiacibacter sp. 219JJ12-13]
MRRDRSPGMKLFFAGVVAAVLVVPLLAVYALVYDRESQSERAQAQITAGWGGPQVVAGPVLVVPYLAETVEAETVNGVVTERRRQVRRELFVSPLDQSVTTELAPDRKGYAIYESVVYSAAMRGEARYVLTDELESLDIESSDLLLDEAELRFGISDPRGLTDGARVVVNGAAASLDPGGGLQAAGGSGFSAPVAGWTADAPLQIEYSYGLRGTGSLSLVPRGGETEWRVTSPWPHPSFTGGFLPDPELSETTADGFEAVYPGITNLALGQELVSAGDLQGEPIPVGEYAVAEPVRPVIAGATQVVTIALVDPVDLYSQVDRAVKYGFLFIGFTFATLLMFDIVGGARVAAAEYLLTGAGLVLFFVMLLAFAEVVGFTLAYVLAAAAIIALLTAYSAAVLGGWRRASFIGLMLAALYCVLYVLLNEETYSLVIGSVLLFAALAGIMYATRGVDWAAVGRKDEDALT